MKKVVIGLVLLIIIAGGAWYFLRPAPDMTTAKGAKQIALETCNEEATNMVLLVEAIQDSNPKKCDRISGYVREYCHAWFGTDKCTTVLRATGCQAILARNPAECADDEICHAILGNQEACTYDECRSVAQRDAASLATGCGEVADIAERNTQCTEKAQSFEEYDACVEASQIQ